MYKVVGADRREYGPVSRETILEWIGQGRANAQTIAKFEEGPWRPLATFDEFKAALGVTVVPGATAASPTETPPGTGAPGGAGTTPLIQTTYVSSEPPPYSGVGSQAKETNVCSVIGLIVPLVCCCCPFAGPLIGIVFSLIGLSQIRANPEKYSTSDALPKIGLGIGIAILILHVVLRILDSTIVRYLPKVPVNF
jgi:hypothetical protein